MAFRNVPGEKSPGPSGKPPEKKSSRRAGPGYDHTIRETVESIVVAFVLAFLFRTFEAEAFVIPTGSMAPTLQGRHKDVICEKVPISVPGWSK